MNWSLKLGGFGLFFVVGNSTVLIRNVYRNVKKFSYFSTMKTIHVAAAVIIQDEKILCVQRNENKFDYISKKWEFPGGKVEENEKIEETIIREIKEELNLEIKIKNFLIQVDHSYPDFRIIMDTFECEIIGGNLYLNEHIDSFWLNRNELNQLDWAEADLPIVSKLKN
jgi:8-oxo-dGTP diphosphatase